MLGFISQQGSSEKDPLLLWDALENGVHPYPAPQLQKGVHTSGLGGATTGHGTALDVLCRALWSLKS